MSATRPGKRERTRERLRHHYEVEARLAAQLRAAPREHRFHMLTGLYEELFREVPDHPRLVTKLTPEMSRREVMRQMQFLRRFLRKDMTLLEIGPGDCALSFEAAKSVRRVYAVDVDAVLSRNARPPANFRLFLSDGVSVPVPPDVDLAYSNQLMEHLHPEDARQQLSNIFATLAAGGAYVCITPNRLNGPHDISRAFSDEPRGFHLKEYTMSELHALLIATGFRSVVAYARTKSVWFRVPMGLIRILEAALGRLPATPRRAIADRWPLRHLLNAALVARR
jgi:cyclopropane fatty-acyl-phospholipid synthase-like methyltransferase